MQAQQYFAMMKAVEARALAMASRMKAIGQKMALAITAPLLIIGGLAVHEFGKFDSAMTKSTAIMGEMSDEMRQNMEDVARSISLNAVQSATELAEAYFFLASAGLSAAESIAALPVVTKFATAGTFEMAEATDLLTDAQSALGLTVDDTAQSMLNMTRVSDVLVKGGHAC